MPCLLHTQAVWFLLHQFNLDKFYFFISIELFLFKAFLFKLLIISNLYLILRFIFDISQFMLLFILIALINADIFDWFHLKWLFIFNI